MARLTGSKRRKKQLEIRTNRSEIKGVGGGQGNKKRQAPGSTKTKSTDKAAWLKKTRNSPAAKAGLSADQRWAAYQRNQKNKKK
tara:strand:+ start:320 stop:571 length:252 start_codon:yes stop_codon:yes gene_type:complete